MDASGALAAGVAGFTVAIEARGGGGAAAALEAGAIEAVAEAVAAGAGDELGAAETDAVDGCG